LKQQNVNFLPSVVDRPGRVRLCTYLLPYPLTQVVGNRLAGGRAQDQPQYFGLDAGVIPPRSGQRDAFVELRDSGDGALSRGLNEIALESGNIVWPTIGFSERDS
jgi:hypothetical protein